MPASVSWPAPAPTWLPCWRRPSLASSPRPRRSASRWPSRSVAALGLDDYLILQKTAKIHLADALAEPLSSITTGGEQRLLLDRARIPAVAGKRVALVDDVIATGGSIVAALRLLRAAGADVVGIGSLLVEGTGWRSALGDDAALVRPLGVIPMFTHDAAGGWVERG